MNELFQSLNRKRDFTLKEAMKAENMMKNRFGNNWAHDQTLVKLSSGNYINANYVLNKSVIATQAPLNEPTRLNTVPDFWHMVFEHRSPVILNLTENFEYIIEGTYDGLVLEKSNGLTNKYGIDLLVLALTKNGSTHKVACIHFKDWADFSVPDMEKSIRLMKLFITIKKHMNELNKCKGPPIIHCLAGLGRTGVFLCCLEIVKRLQRGCKEVSLVHNIIDKLRDERLGLVQTVEQYKFCYLFKEEVMKII
jgi:protein tyrosine phosphatase